MGHMGVLTSWDAPVAKPDKLWSAFDDPIAGLLDPEVTTWAQQVRDASGRVTSLVDPDGNTTSYDYSGMDTATGNGDVIFQDADGNMTEYYYENGELSSETTGFEQSLSATVQTKYSSTMMLPTSSLDADQDTTTDTYDAVGNVLSETDPLGNSTSYTYNSFSEPVTVTNPGGTGASGPTPVAPGGVITPPSAVPPEGVSYTLYDTYGNALWTTTGVYEPGAPTASYAQTTYSLYAGNSVTLNGTDVSCLGGRPPHQYQTC